MKKVYYFVGKDGSLGLKSGDEYVIDIIKNKNDKIIVHIQDYPYIKESIYTNQETFNQNWKKPQIIYKERLIKDLIKSELIKYNSYHIISNYEKIIINKQSDIIYQLLLQGSNQITKDYITYSFDQDFLNNIKNKIKIWEDTYGNNL